MSTFNVKVRQSNTDRVFQMEGASRREIVNKLNRNLRDKPFVILSIEKEPHSKTKKALPPHIAGYLGGAFFSSKEQAELNGR